jgi:RHS repeat-associated protein
VWVRARGLCDYYSDPYAMLECQQSLVRRTIWDGERELWEIQMPDTADYREQDTVTVNLPRLVVEPNDEEVDPHPFYGRILYTHGLELDQPMGITRFGYVDFKQGTQRTVFQPFTVIPNWSLRGDPDRQYLADTTVTACSGGFAPCVLLEDPMQWWAYGAPPRLMDHWYGTIIENKADRSGVFYRRNRYYDPQTGRFTQEDPIGLAGGINLYGFAAGDPINFSDPYGLRGCIGHEDRATIRHWKQIISTATDTRIRWRGNCAEKGSATPYGTPGMGGLSQDFISLVDSEITFTAAWNPTYNSRQWNPFIISVYDDAPDGNLWNVGPWGKCTNEWRKYEFAQVFAHEMIHHLPVAKLDSTGKPGSMDLNEERAVKKGDNRYNFGRGRPPRCSHQ